MTVAPVTLPFQILITSSSKVNIQQYKVMTTTLGTRREEEWSNLAVIGSIVMAHRLLKGRIDGH